MRANDHRPSGDKLRRNALKGRLRTLRKARSRALDAGLDVADLDAEIGRVERALATWEGDPLKTGGGQGA